MEKVIAYLGLGSNLETRDENLGTAMRCLGEEPVRTGAGQVPNDSSAPSCPGKVQVLRASSIYQTSPWGLEDQPDFLNCVLEVRTGLSPAGLLERIKLVEKQMGRQPGPRYGPRLIDVDILFFGDITLDRPDLQIPHPRLHQRAFALIPLAELDRNLVHPTLQTTVGILIERVDGREGVVVWGPPPTVTWGERRAELA